ncbi:hypothetical protein [Chitinilyticum litopenaei]|uniref:hypothetical protein n=1 Tax=Chitinilyticum litopenaei TaxID=1121276 RepID=UPI0011855490|nr:hypothetical protein [Chitinilyticum litopenaei]
MLRKLFRELKLTLINATPNNAAADLRLVEAFAGATPNCRFSAARNWLLLAHQADRRRACLASPLPLSGLTRRGLLQYTGKVDGIYQHEITLRGTALLLRYLGA